jgi:hypothetical protein
MNATSFLKVVAATATIIGIILSFLEHWFAPNVLVTEDSPNYPNALRWLGWLLASAGAVAYIVIDFLSKK